VERLIDSASVCGRARFLFLDVLETRLAAFAPALHRLDA
jgi:hypothetical protein